MTNKTLREGFIFVGDSEDINLWYIDTDEMTAQWEQGEDIALIESNQGKIDKFDGDIDSYLNQFGYEIGDEVEYEFEKWNIKRVSDKRKWQC